MKKYIMVTGTITRMGGAQMYVSNKAKFMREKGYEVFVFSGLQGPILIEGLKPYENSIMRELEIVPMLYTQKEQERIVSHMQAAVHASKDDEIVIESNAEHTAYWAELLAQRLNGRHYIFLLDESFAPDAAYTDFFRCKLKRHEFAVIKENVLHVLFQSRELPADLAQYVLVAPCNNVVEDIPDTYLADVDITAFDFVCCSLGRLNKEYIPSVADGFQQFAQQHPGKKILYIFIGDQPTDWPVDVGSRIAEKLGNMPNVTLKMLGYVFPIPRAMLGKIQLSAASAGSCYVLAREDVPVIAIDAADYDPIGVFGYDTMQAIFREKACAYTLAEYMDKILCENYLDGMQSRFEKEVRDKKYMEEHIVFLQKASSEAAYYPVSGLKASGKKAVLKKACLRILGKENYNRIKAGLKHGKSSLRGKQ